MRTMAKTIPVRVTASRTLSWIRLRHASHISRHQSGAPAGNGTRDHVPQCLFDRAERDAEFVNGPRRPCRPSGSHDQAAVRTRLAASQLLKGAEQFGVLDVVASEHEFTASADVRRGHHGDRDVPCVHNAAAPKGWPDVAGAQKLTDPAT